MAELVEVFVNGTALQVPEGTSVLDACKKANAYVPTLCYHPMLKPVGRCGLCYVDIEGQTEGVLACSTKVSDGMRINTTGPNVTKHSLSALNAIMDRVKARQGHQFPGKEMQNLMQWAQNASRDTSSPSVIRDMSLCVECGRCARACKQLQGIGVLKLTSDNLCPIKTENDIPLIETDCISCGQCANLCPVGAMQEVSDFTPLINALRDPEMVVIAQTAPATRVGFGEAFGMPAGHISTSKMVGVLKKAGFMFVFDTNFSADLTIMEEGTELLGRVGKGGPFPMFTSCCPGWINLLEQKYPEFIPNVSSCKSPQQMLGAVIKTYWAERMGKRPDQIYSVSVMPCTAKKHEITREDMGRDGYKDVDYVMTVRELAKFCKEHVGITEWENIPDCEYDNPMAETTGAAVIFGVTGGVMEAAVRTVYEVQTGQRLDKLDFEVCRGFQGVKEAVVPIGDLNVKIAIVHGGANVQGFLDSIKDLPDHGGYHFVEIMACPCGCINGGGQPRVSGPEALEARMDSIYSIDERATIRRSHENPQVKALYDQFLGQPNSHKAHELLHCHYHSRKTAPVEAAAAPKATTGKSVAIIYATQTGTTEQAARRLSNMLKNAKFETKLFSADDYSASDLAGEGLAIFLTSTFGEGERLDVSAGLYDALLDMDSSALNGLRYAVFGLGSSKYAKFCQAAIDFDVAFEKAGAQRLVACGMGDELADDGYYTAMDPWLGLLYEELGVDPPKQALVPHFRVVLSLQAPNPAPPPPGTMFGSLTERRLLTAEGYPRPIYLFDFDMADTGLTYEVGDAVGIHPSNPPQHVETFLSKLGLDGNIAVSILPAGEGSKLALPPSLTIRQLFTQYLDIFAKPGKLFFRNLAQFATNPAEKARLELLGSNDGKEELAAYLADYPAYVDVLEDFPSARPSIDYLFEILPMIKPRLYSVASSPKMHPTSVQLVIGVPAEVNRARGKIPGGGLTTYWLANDLEVGGAVPLLVHTGTLRPPRSSDCPMVMAGLGTGIAPMRALLQDRKMDKDAGLPIGRAVLYQAVRHREKDFVLQDEMEMYKAEGCLTEIIGCFSHDNPERFETADLVMKEQPAPVWSVLKEDNGYYFYCGPAAWNIPAKLQAALMHSMVACGGMSEAQAQKYFDKLMGQGRICQEAF
eukprot:gnl/Trimastix_PCT/547.p1 GENE.gnl/Trimastix_PCT/547~~gnl/Trimastix_PCT/547.p1  ORF type:complete len:1171 (-),score=510.50 gnl/Trimastix_PCT/547:436-3882(-)